MLFNSLEFLLFFPIVTFLFYVLPHKFRWMHLLVASSIFYMFFIPHYILILLATILIDYLAGIWIEKSSGRKKRLYLIMSIISTCLILFVFKYFNFFNHNVFVLGQYLGFNFSEKIVNLILPIGLSFHTFQSLSYVIEVYRGKQKAEKHFGIYSLYVMFYPQLVTGPIERPQNLLVQLRQKISFDYTNLSHGLRLILFGLFTKMVIADNLGVYVDQIYADPSKFNSYSIVLGILLYSFQIYCDFYGYSTIAVGCAKAMGYNLMDNFKNPYLSKSIGEFWQRWHISLSTWFRDYVYISLGGNRVKIQRWALNILIVFVLSGLWHGANWTFVLWGFAHGLIYLAESIFDKYAKFKISAGTLVTNLIVGIKIIKTFLIASLIWVLFRATDLTQIKAIMQSILHNRQVVDDFHIDIKVWILFAFFIVLDILMFNSRFDTWCSKRHVALRWILYAVLIFSVIVLSSVNNYPFIYFQF